MDTQTPSTLPKNYFETGSSVIYAMHGKCVILGTETRALNGESIEFYKLEPKRTTHARTQKSESAIWVPTATALEQGLRAPLNRETAEEVLRVLSSREYYFKMNESWKQTLPQLESCIRKEGAIGLAKVASYLFVLKRRNHVVAPEINRFQESIHKLLFRELSDALAESIRSLEERITKGFKAKLLPDH